MKAKIVLLSCITVIFLGGLFGCSTTAFSPGPKGTLGPQGEPGPSSENAVDIESSDVLVEIEYPLSGFTEIAVSDLFEVEIRQGEVYRVLVEAEETIAPYHDISVQGKTLQIGLNPNYTYNIESTKQRVEVTLPSLTGVRVSDFSTVTVEGFEAEEGLRLDVVDFGKLRGSITAGVVEIKVNNHAELILGGSASQVIGEVMNFSTADLTNLEAGELDIDTDRHSSLVQ